VLVGGLVGLVLIGIGLIALTAERATDVSTLPYPDIPRISPAEAYQQQEAGTAVLVDVRDEPFYRESHAAGAISVPENELLARLDELPADKTLILY
jgi:hypothetical protein